MKLLIVVCVLLTANAAKLQGYEPPLHGFPDISLSTFPGALAPAQNAFISGTPQQGQFQSSSIGLIGAQPQQSFVGLNQQNSQQIFLPGRSSGQPILDTQIHGTVSHGNAFPIVHDQQNSLGFEAGDLFGSCPDGLVRHFDGTCVTPEVVRNVFVYAAPQQEPKPTSPPPSIPLPKLEHNIVFIRTPEQGAGVDPIIVPPPQKKHVVYVLNKQEDQEQKVIEVPAPEPKTPEVFFVNYAEGETPNLPDGIDFDTALNSAIHSEGQIIGGSNGFTQSIGENTVVNEFGVTSGLANEVIGSGNSGLIFASELDFSEDHIISNNGGNRDFIVGSGGPQIITSHGQFSGLSGNVGASNGQFSGINGILVSNNGQSSGFNGNVVTSTSPPPHQLYIAP